MSSNGLIKAEGSLVGYVTKVCPLVGFAHGCGRGSVLESQITFSLDYLVKEGLLSVDLLFIPVTIWYGPWASGSAGAVVLMLRLRQRLAPRACVSLA